MQFSLYQYGSYPCCMVRMCRHTYQYDYRYMYDVITWVRIEFHFYKLYII